MDEEEKIKKESFKDLKPENKRNRKEPLKPWGIKERLFVLFSFLITVISSSILALSSRNFKLPNFPRMTVPDLSSINIFKEQTIVVGNKGSDVSKEKIDSIKKEFKEKTYKYSGIYSFYIYDLNGDYYYGLGYQDSMQAASLIKLPVMAAVYMEAEKGNLDIKDYIVYLESMGKRSDNEAFKKVINLLGKEKINQTIKQIGMTNTLLDENLTTAEDVGLFFKKIYNYELINKENSMQLLSFLTDTIYEDWLRAGIPSDIKVAHKYGREVHVINDAGIVFDSKPFIMVLMSEGIVDEEASGLLPILTKMLYNRHISK